MVAGRLHHDADDLVDRLEELVGRLLDMATEIELARGELVFAQPPLTEDELEAAA